MRKFALKVVQSDWLVIATALETAISACSRGELDWPVLLALRKQAPHRSITRRDQPLPTAPFGIDCVHCAILVFAADRRRRFHLSVVMLNECRFETASILVIIANCIMLAIYDPLDFDDTGGWCLHGINSGCRVFLIVVEGRWTGCLPL